jgi:hypothetical protein
MELDPRIEGNPATLQIIADAAKMIGVYESKSAEQAVQLRDLLEERRNFVKFINELEALRDRIGIQVQDYADLLELFERKCAECIMLRKTIDDLHIEHQKTEIQIRMTTNIVLELRRNLE